MARMYSSALLPDVDHLYVCDTNETNKLHVRAVGLILSPFILRRIVLDSNTLDSND